MQYRMLGSTGLRVSVIGMGTWQFGGEWGKDFAQDEVNAIFNAARESGINLIDTAECYGDHLSESLIGGAIKADRDKWIVATKFGHKFTGHLQRTEPRSPTETMQQIDDSLRALQTDYVDLLQYHSWGDDQFFADDVLAVLQRAKQSGKVRHLGNSISKNDNLKQTAASAERGLEVIQIIYNRLDRTPEGPVFASCVEQNVGVLARVPMASGYLSGKYKPGATFPEGDVRHGHKREEIDAKLREVEKIQRDEVPPGVPMAQWALAWCLKNPAVTAVIPGCKDVEQTRINAAAADFIHK